MTLREAGELYAKRKDKIEDMKQDMKSLARCIELGDQYGLCSIRKDIATNLLKYLVEYEKELETELDLHI